MSGAGELVRMHRFNGTLCRAVELVIENEKVKSLIIDPTPCKLSLSENGKEVVLVPIDNTKLGQTRLERVV